MKDEEVVKIESKELFLDKKVVLIVHNKQTYTLRVTRDNKLILTK